MDERWRNSIVAIAAPKARGGSKTGTGILVAPGLVLTAAHVVEFDGAEGPVRLRWKSATEEFGKTSGDKSNGFHDALCGEGRPRGVAWRCPDLDLALVACSAPPDIHPVAICHHPPRDGLSWAGDAYPAICDNRFDASKYLSGAMSSLEHHGRASRFALAARQELRSDGGETVSVAQWSGASGMPVIWVSDDRPARIIGVLTTEHTLFESCFDATPISEALKDQAFRTCLGLREPETAAFLREQLVAAAAAFLKIDSAATLVREARLFGGACADDLSGEQLAAALIAAEDDEPLRDVLDSFWRSLSHPYSDEALKLVTALLVYRFARDHGADLAFCGGAVASAAPCDSLVGAEIAMAGHHGRSVEFRRRRDPGDRPAGTLCLEPPPEAGRNVANAPHGIDWSRRVGADVAAGLERSGKRPKHHKSFLRNQARSNRRYYTAYPIEKPHEIAAQVDAACKALCAERGWPEICVVLFDPDDDTCDDEKRFGFMCEMLPLEGGQGDPSQ